MNDFLDITGIPRTDIVSASGVCPPPVAICPQTAATLHSHRLDPLGLATLDEVGNAISILQPLHLALRTEAKPPRYVSPVRDTVPRLHALECSETLLMNGPSLSRLMMRLLADVVAEVMEVVNLCLASLSWGSGVVAFLACIFPWIYVCFSSVFCFPC